MSDLRARFVIDFLYRTQRNGFRLRQRQGQIRLADLAQNQLRQCPPERRPGRNATAIIAAKADNPLGKPMEARHGIARHADLAIPFGLELDIAQLRKQPLQAALCPGAVDRSPAMA